MLAIETPYRNAFLDELCRTGDYEVTAIYCSPSSQWREWALPATRHTKVLLRGIDLGGSGGAVSIPVNFGLRAALRAADPSFIVVGGYATPTMHLAMAWGRKRRIPYALLSESHALPPRSRLRRAISKAAGARPIRNAHVLFGASSAAVAELVSRGPRTDRLAVLPNSPDVRWFARESQRVQSDAHRGPRLLFVGRLVKQKDPLTLVRAVAIARQHCPDLCLTIVGSGPLEDALRSEIAHLSLGEVVSLKGFVQPNDLPQLYASHDLFVLPSLDEPFGVVVLEAMAAGLPVILSSHVGCGPDLVVPEIGEIFDAGSPQDLSRAVVELVGRQSLRAMGATSRARALTLDLDHCVAVFRQAVPA